MQRGERVRRGKGCMEKGSLRKESMEVGVRVRGAWEGVHREVHRKGVHLEGVHGGGGGVHGEGCMMEKVGCIRKGYMGCGCMGLRVECMGKGVGSMGTPFFMQPFFPMNPSLMASFDTPTPST